MAKYEVLERSFINGQLLDKGATVVLEIDNPGSNLKLLTEEGDDGATDLKGALIAELKALGVAADRRDSVEKLRAKLADAKGE